MLTIIEDQLIDHDVPGFGEVGWNEREAKLILRPPAAMGSTEISLLSYIPLTGDATIINVTTGGVEFPFLRWRIVASTPSCSPATFLAITPSLSSHEVCVMAMDAEALASWHRLSHSVA